MSEADSESPEQCTALTNSGDRCQNPATQNGFCHQHSESDPTVDDASGDESADGADEGGEEAAADGGAAESAEREDSDPEDGGESADAESDAAEDGDSAEKDADAESEDGDSAESSDDEESASSSDEADVSVGETGSLMDIRATVKRVSAELIERPLDGVVEIQKHDDEWRATVEVVERRAVPDTQDIIGQYELTLDDPETVTGYRRLSRFRRNDTDRTEPLE